MKKKTNIETRLNKTNLSSAHCSLQNPYLTKIHNILKYNKYRKKHRQKNKESGEIIEKIPSPFLAKNSVP